MDKTLRQRLAILAIAGGLLVAMFFLLTAGASRRAPTADEPSHLLRGIAYWQTGSADLSYSHPPLPNALAALAIDDLDRIDVTELSGYDSLNPGRMGRAFFTPGWMREALGDLERARFGVVWMSLVFAATVFAWCWRRWDAPTALVALALVAGHPIILAHGCLMTTDMALALASFVAITQFAEWLENRGWHRLLLFAGAIGLLLSAKHTSIVLMAIMAVITGIFAWRAWGRFAIKTTRRRRVLRAAGQFALVTAIGLFCVTATYRFEGVGLTFDEYTERTEPVMWITRPYDNDLLKETPVFVPGSVPIPLPYTYVYGLITIRYQAAIGHSSYLAGFRTRRNGAYFPTLLTIKTPVGILLLLALAAWLVWKRKLVPERRTWTVVALCLAFLGIACLGKINIGVRHVIPLVPIMIVLAARMAVLAWRSTIEVPRLTRIKPAVATAVLTAASAGALAWPYFISHFNVLVGGRWGGHKISVIGEDWGQDVIETAEWLVDNERRSVEYYSGHHVRQNILTAHDIKWDRLKCHEVPRPDSVALVHLTTLVRAPRCVVWREVCTELEVINHHVHIFHCPPSDALEEIRVSEAEIKAELEAAEAAAKEAEGGGGDDKGDGDDGAKEGKEDGEKKGKKKKKKGKKKGRKVKPDPEEGSGNK